MARKQWCMMLSATVLGLTLGAPAYAQQANDGGDTDIVVTARRVDEKLQDVPISITVFNQQTISERNIVNSTDLGTYTPSLSINSRFGPEKASFAIRGFVQEFGTVPSVGVYFADVVAPRGGGATTSGDGAGVGSLFDLQNVQVLKGPQGTLFGRNTTGGAVLLVPRKPTDQFEGHAEGSVGNHDMWRGQAVLNLPLADTFKVRLGVDRMKREGYIKNHSGIGPDHFNDMNYISGRLSVVAELTSDLENYTIATVTDSKTHGTALRVMACVDPTQLASEGQALGAIFGCGQIQRQAARGDGWWDVESNVPNARNHLTTWQIINTTTWTISDTLTLKNIASYGQFNEIARQGYGENWLLPDGSQYSQLINYREFPGSQNSGQATFTEELQLQGRTSDGRLTWQGGGYVELSDPLGYSVQESVFLLNCTDIGALQCAGTGNISIPWQKRRFRTYAGYAQGTYHLTDNLALTAGGRYTWDEQSYYYAGTAVAFPAPNVQQWSCNNQLRNPGPNNTVKQIQPFDFHQCNLSDTAKSHKPTWTVDVEYKPTGDVLLFAKWSRGYRAGGVNPAYAPYNIWGPEKVDTYEIGAKTSFRGAVSGYLNVTGFYNNFRDQQIQASLTRRPDSPVLGGTAILNAGKSRIWGIEADSSVTFFDSLKFDAGYAYLNTRLQALTGIPADDFSPWQPGETPWAQVVPTAAVGEPLALSPKHRLTVTGTYTLPLDKSIGEISVGATYVYTSKQFALRTDDAAFAAGQMLFYPGFPVRNPGLIPATNLLNLNASWRNVLGKPIDLSFFMTNATNEKFPLNAANFFNAFGFESQIVNEPRMFGFRVRYSFGS